jgi:hypothetical protein
MHWLHHTTLTWVERNFGYAVARAYAGHTEGDSAGAPSTYVRASVSEVATSAGFRCGRRVGSGAAGFLGARRVQLDHLV